MKTKETREGMASILVSPVEKISKKMGVFYNPRMKLNRDISIALLNSLDLKKMRIADPLAGTGIRAIRVVKETRNVEEMHINDINQSAYKLIKKNLKLNKIKEGRKVKVFSNEANLFLLNSKGFDYIDIDPFGSPNPYLDSAIKKISRRGLLGVTATDTAALCGSYKNPCLRKYWATPLRNELMHEIGLRILIRKIQLTGAQFEKALTPVFSHSTEHYMRAYLISEKSKEKTDSIQKQHKFFLYCDSCLDRKTSDYNLEKCRYCEKGYSYAGPLWTGKLWDQKLTNKMLEHQKNSDVKKLMEEIKSEAKIDTVGFYDTSRICSKLRINTPKKGFLVERIRGMGFEAAETHFSKTGIRSNISIKELVKLLVKSTK